MLHAFPKYIAMPTLTTDLELIRMGLTPPEVEALATHDPIGLLNPRNTTTRAMLAVALGNGGTVAEFVSRMGQWRGAAREAAMQELADQAQELGMGFE